MSARVYVGLDGVFNSSGAPRSWGLESFDSTDYGGYTFIWSTSAVLNFLAFCHENDVEVVWLTSWWEDIPALARLLGFGKFGADARVIEEVGPSWSAKADALMQDLEDFPVAEGEKWIWLDPAASDAEQSMEFLRVHPKFFDGLTPPVFEEIGITPALMSHLQSDLRKTIMQSTVKLNGVYGVEIGEYAIVSSHGYVERKWLITPEWNQLELNQTDGKVEVTEELLADAETINGFGDLLAEGWENTTPGESGSKMSKLEYVTMRSENDQDSNATWLLDELEGPTEVAVPPSNVKTVTATMKIDGKLGWEYFPGYYLLEGGLSYSPYSRPPIQEDKIEPAEGEFTVHIDRYVDATSTAEKLGFIAEADRLGVEGYID